MLDRVYVVTTPENLTLRFQRAGLASRAAGLALDVLVMAAVVRGSALLLAPFEHVASAAASALWIVVGFVVQWWYGALCEWRFGRTLGKRLLGLRVLDHAGLPPSLPQALLRNLLRLLDLLPGFHLTGALVCLLDPQGRRLGDLAAQTLVVRTTRPSVSGSRSRTEPSPDVQSEAFAASLSAAEAHVVRTLEEAREVLPEDAYVPLRTALYDHLRTRHAALAADSGDARALRQVAEALQARDDQES